MIKETPYLYLLCRNDLDSMNGGKAIAHGAHAANKFTYDMANMIIGRDESPTADERHVEDQYKDWLKSANGFGTTISLSMNLLEIQTTVTMAKSLDRPASEVVDPEYPYFLHSEYAGLIKHPEDHPPVPARGGLMLCIREEITCGYIFGMKDMLKPILGSFPMVD